MGENLCDAVAALTSGRAIQFEGGIASDSRGGRQFHNAWETLATGLAERLSTSKADNPPQSSSIDQFSRVAEIGAAFVKCVKISSFDFEFSCCPIYLCRI